MAGGEGEGGAGGEVGGEEDRDVRVSPWTLIRRTTVTMLVAYTLQVSHTLLISPFIHPLIIFEFHFVTVLAHMNHKLCFKLYTRTDDDIITTEFSVL